MTPGCAPTGRPGGLFFPTVVFDCDSTLTTIEGIDRLAGDDPEVRRLTREAMAGRLPLDDVYRRRLARVSPSRAQVERLGADYAAALAEDAGAVVAALARAGVAVRVVSGGLRPAVVELARVLGLDDAAVDAVDLRFDSAGNYAGFDEASPLWRSGGKLRLLDALAERLTPPVMLVGDGATDAEAAPAVDLFVAYAGVAARRAVLDAADVAIRCRSLTPVLPLALPASAVAAVDRAFYDKGLELLGTEAVDDRRRPTPQP